MFNDLKMPAIYTMESSFCGNDQGPYANYHFSLDNLLQMGRDFCRTLFIYNHISLPQNMTENLLQQIMSLYEHYRLENEDKNVLQKDREVEAMAIFQERIKQLYENNTEITTKQLKKALLLVLKT